MLKKHFSSLIYRGLFGLVALGVAGGAQAAINLDDGMGKVTYAKETLTTGETSMSPGGGGTVTKDGVTYYVIGGDSGSLNVVAKTGLGGPSGSTLTIQYHLRNAVFVDPLTAASLTGGEIPAEGVSIRAYGAARDNRVTFIVNRGPTFTPASTATLVVPRIAVSANAAVSISMVATDQLDDTVISKSLAGAISLGKGIMPVGENLNPVALVTAKFLKFKNTGDDAATMPTTDTVSVGSVAVEPNTTVMKASNGMAVAELADVIMAGGITLDTAPATVTGVVFSGDFSFVSRAWLGANVAGCTDETAETADLRMAMDQDTMMRDLTRLRTQSLAYVNGNMHLCLMVDTAAEDQMPIPATAPYVATKTFAGITGAAFPPSVVEHAMGRITRDGTTVRLPYLTQFGGYNQRIVIRNRGGAAPYSFTFHTEDGIMAILGADAEGMLEANSVKVISMMFGDLVTIQGTPNRTAATLVVEAQQGDIDVSVSQTNMDGGTDTTHLTPTNR